LLQLFSKEVERGKDQEPSYQVRSA